MSQEEEEPASPGARLMQAPGFNLCILAVMGYLTPIDVNLFKNELERTLVKHPRFSSLLIVNNKKLGKYSWKRTKVDLEKHVIAPDLDPEMENPDAFVEDYISGLSKNQLDQSKPVWEVHVLNVKNSDANSTIIFKIDHSIGDGVSLISLVMACARKNPDPESLPVIPPKKQKKNNVKNNGLMKRLFVLVWTMFLIIFNTLSDCICFLATILFLKDTETVIKAGKGVELYPKKYVRRIISLDEVKFVKNAMNVDLAEMMEKEKLLKGMWGNIVGIVILPLTIVLQDDPLNYIRRAKATMDRKKLSLGHSVAFGVMKLMLMLFGNKIAAGVSTGVFRNTTLTFSNVVGPKEEINVFGHPLAYIAPSVFGADEKFIPNPHQLGDDLVKSFENIKEAVIKSGLVKGSEFC
ncbi:hypothetical protein DH2020_031052 [Rehmannia glutinosa]|uniref:Diacylglycerol O-acyltransferase n=1 Tax=Rehmannia glutinosa TaxID=99300 RepID=A0ABR0VMH7_REHGL